MGQMSDMSDRLNRLLAQASTYRSRAEVTGFFDGLELVEPGVTPIQQWRPDTPEEASAVAAMWGGVAFKVLDNRTVDPRPGSALRDSGFRAGS